MIDSLLAHDDRRTRHFTYLCFSAAPILGSVASVAVIAGAVGGVIEVCRRIIPISRDRVMILLAAPLLVYSLAYLVSLLTNPLPAWKDSLPVLPFLMFPFLYSSWCISRKETVARAVVGGSVIGCYGAVALAAFQVLVYDIRAEGGASNAIVFATVTSLATGMALAGALSTSRNREAALFLGGYLAGAISILYSGSRITWVGLLLSSLAILWIFRERWLVRLSLRTAARLALALLVVVLAAAHSMPPRIEALRQDWRHIQDHGDYDSSLGHRVVVWRSAIAIIEQSPIVGTGPQSTKPIIDEAMSGAGLMGGYSHFHNGLLTAWVETGVFGALALLLVFVSAAGIALHTLKRTAITEARLGAVMLIVVSVIYVTTGTTGIVVGHDILDSMLIAFLAVGGYLAGGTSMLRDAKTTPLDAIDHENSPLAVEVVRA